MGFDGTPGDFWSDAGPACDLCGSCRYFSVNKNSSHPYNCSGKTTESAFFNRKHKQPLDKGGCNLYEPRGSAGTAGAQESKHKGKFGIGAGLGQVFDGMTSSNLDNLAAGTGKVALGLGKLAGKGLLSLGKLGVKGISKGISAAQQAKNSAQNMEEEDAYNEEYEEAEETAGSTETIFCSNCGKKLSASAKFCSGCGTQVGA